METADDKTKRMRELADFMRCGLKASVTAVWVIVLVPGIDKAEREDRSLWVGFLHCW
jgi:hypothetical protein